MKLTETFGDWHAPMEPLLGSEIFEHIGLKLVDLHKEGKHIIPSFDCMFRPFSECHPLDLKVVMVLPAPYDIKGYADGLALSTKAAIAPSWLKHLRKAWEEDFGAGFDLSVYQGSNDLSYLANQGVLMLNAAFTCEPGEPAAHRELWRPFTESVLKMISYYFKDIVFIMVGGMTEDFIPCIEEPKHTVLSCYHPASADYADSKWEHCGVFKRCNNILKAKGISPVQWYSSAAQEVAA